LARRVAAVSSMISAHKRDVRLPSISSKSHGNSTPASQVSAKPLQNALVRGDLVWRIRNLWCGGKCGRCVRWLVDNVATVVRHNRRRQSDVAQA
jgi:hypothetical protein